MKIITTQILQKLTLSLLVLISISNTYASALDADSTLSDSVSSVSSRLGSDPVIPPANNTPDEVINIELLSNQLLVTLGDSKLNYGSICIINSQGKVVYLNEGALANSSTIVAHEFNDFESFFIVKVILGNNAISKKYVLGNQ
jgi:hypothetical protein